ncbi:AAA family ATPase [Capilliphycus salinus ALCB114379]|uniref:AAA family ATPase n=1 Tax=Capilliphycus salinus TaxID=2768948 RepID=UPI0039A632A8
MKPVTGYHFHKQIYVSFRTLIYRGFREADQKPVVVKLCRHLYPTFSELAQYRNAYALIAHLDLPGVVKMLALEPVDQRLMLVMEDFGGISLSQYLNQRGIHWGNDTNSLTEFLQIALQLAEILEQLHHHQIIHKDIKPHNIIINPQTQKIQLIDFSCGSQLPKQIAEIRSPNRLEGTLAYLSPEQTGRMNRGIDYRSDFYSLGVTFYQLLTGQLPFIANDPMELIHSHIAREPRPLSELNSNLPEAINALVLKLMSKMPESRYQTALGLKKDLQKCLSLLQKTGAIETFYLAKNEVNDRFLISEKIYGRDREVETLLGAFERVAGSSQRKTKRDKSRLELMLVSGFSGIGKSALVNEIHKPIVEKKGYFISGKFDQYQRDIPFSAWIGALQNLIKQILSEPEHKVAAITAKLKQALGQEARVLVDVIPELERLIGEQPPVTELSFSATQNRFNLLFQKFISVFAQVEHPLVIFLDDLQWADLASLQLIQLLTELIEPCCLFIGSYRDNEVNSSHPLIHTLENINKLGVPVNQITLQPLSGSALNQLVADTLNCSLEKALPLTEQVEYKTQGNPFFAAHFLKYIQAEGLIFYNLKQEEWQYKLNPIQVLAENRDIIELIAIQLKKLPQESLEVLQLAACMGNQFDLATLAIISDKTRSEAASFLWIALQEGLILPEDETYKFYQLDGDDSLQLTLQQQYNPSYHFLHDRVQQAAYSLIPEDQKASIHLNMGRLLLQSFSSDSQEEKIFDIVNHLNQGKHILSTTTEKVELAQLNLKSAQKAKNSTAYAAAMNYAEVGLELIASQGWNKCSELTYKLHVEAVETAFLKGDLERMDHLIEIVLKHTENPLKKVKVYEVLIQSLAAQNRLLEAVETTLIALELLGIHLPKQPSQSDVQREINYTQMKLAETSIESLVHLPEMTEEIHLSAMRLLARVWGAAYISVPNLMPITVLKQVNLSVERGNTATSAFAYASYGLILCGQENKIEEGYQFAQLALHVLERFRAKELKTKTWQIIYTFITHWKEHLRNSFSPLYEVYSLGIETGELETAGYAIVAHSYYSYFGGVSLVELKESLNIYQASLTKIKQKNSLNNIQLYLNHIFSLMESSDQPLNSFMQRQEDEEKILSLYQSNNDLYALANFYILKAILYYLFLQPEEAVILLENAEPFLEGVVGQPWIPVFYFYSCLAQLAVYSSASSTQQQKIETTVIQFQEKIQNWADHAPMNYLHKYHLVEAEFYRVQGQKIEAIEAFDRAISLAKENQYIQEEALANELAARFYLNWGKTKVAQTYLIEAYYGYIAWGATAKVQHLEQHYPELLAPILVRDNEGEDLLSYSSISSTGCSSNSTSSRTYSFLDSTTVIKACQALSSEIKLENLLSTLMQLAIENAGAQKCALIEYKEEQLILEAIAYAPPRSSRDQSGSLESFQHLSVEIENCTKIPQALIHYVWRTSDALVFEDAATQASWMNDVYLEQQKPKSVLCCPIAKQNQIIGILYLENNLITAAFTPERLEILELITTQAAISLENARLYENLTTAKAELETANQTLEQKVEQRTQELHEKNQDLANTLKRLKQTQAQLIQTEKMSSLGQLVAGVAHEINNPVNFIYGNIAHAQEYAEDLLNVIEAYQQCYPEPDAFIQNIIEQVDLEFLI